MLKYIWLLVTLTLLSACSRTTTINGTVTDQANKPVSYVQASLGYNPEDTVTTQTDLEGKFQLSYRETCYIICAGGDPSLLIKKEGYKTIEAFVPRFESSRQMYILR